MIIPTYNRAYILRYCLKHILNQTVNDIVGGTFQSRYEVIVVDDASTDETPELISKLKTQNSKLKHIKLDKQSGPYVARNIGIKKAKGDLIIFIDSDVLVHHRFIEDHLRIHKTNKNLVLQGMVHHTRSINSANFRCFFPNALCLRTFITQNVSVRKEWLEKAGGFSEFGDLMGYKDVEMGLKLKGLKLKWVYGIRKCRAYHIDGPAKIENLEKFFIKCMSQGSSAYFFVQKYGKIAERYAHTKKAVLISNLLETEKWVEQTKTIKFLEQSRDSPLIFIFPILKGIMRYHYRAKGIREASKQ